jgi:hypothetical protein
MFFLRLFLVAMLVAVVALGKDTLKTKKKSTYPMAQPAEVAPSPPDVSFSPMKSVRKMVQPPRPRLRLKGKYFSRKNIVIVIFDLWRLMRPHSFRKWILAKACSTKKWSCLEHLTSFTKFSVGLDLW